MKELEIKILEIDRDQIVQRLESNGGRKVFDGLVESMFFDFPNKLLRSKSSILRLRTSGSQSALALKRTVDRSLINIQDEFEVTVSDWETMATILGSLGLVPWIEMKKHRTRYQIEDVHFEIDKYLDDFAYIPEFLEIEAPSIEKLYSYAALLGYSQKQCQKFDALELAEYYS